MRSVVPVVLALLGGCADGELTRSSCAELYERHEDERAAEICDWEYQRTRAPETAVLAMRSRFRLGHDDEVLRWSETLSRTEEAGVGWAYAGLVHDRRGERAEQVVAFEHARRAFLEQGQPGKAARAALDQMHGYWRLSDLRRAFDALDDGLRHARDAGDPGLEAAFAYDLFPLLYDVGDLAGARWTLERAKALAAPDDHEAWARLWLAEGNLEVAEEQHALATLAYQEVLRHAEASGSRDEALLARFNLAEVALRRGEPAVAASYLARVEAEVGPRPSNAARRTTLRYWRARVAAAEGRDFAARTELDAALAEPLLAPDWAWQLWLEQGRLEARAGRIPHARAALETAIATVETLRSELGLESFKEGLLEQRRAPYEAAFVLEAEAGDVEAALGLSERARGRAFLDAIATERRPAPLDDVRSLGTRFDGLLTMVRRGGTTGSSPTRPWAELQPSLGALNALVYFSAEGRLFLVAIAEGQPRLFTLPTPVDRIEALVSSWRSELDDRAKSLAVADAILPPEALPLAGSTLLVIADGPVAHVPFPALWRDRFLVEEHAVVYAPSLEVAARRREARRAEPTTSPPVVLGDATGDLPYARMEAEDVAARLGVDAMVGPAADRAALRSSGRATLLHLATHGGLDDRGAWVALADHRTYAFELLDDGVAPRVAVLASCGSADRSGTSLWGSVAAALFSSGSNAVIATAWSVQDAVSHRFVRELYDDDLATRPIEALARAQRSFIAADEPISMWAAFSVLGVPLVTND